MGCSVSREKNVIEDGVTAAGIEFTRSVHAHGVTYLVP